MIVLVVDQINILISKQTTGILAPATPVLRIVQDVMLHH